MAKLVYLDDERHADLKELAHVTTTMADLIGFAIEGAFEDDMEPSEASGVLKNIFATRRGACLSTSF